MPTSFFARRGGDAETHKPILGMRVGHVYLDTQRRRLHCLNETARDMVREGVPITREDLARQPLQTLAGQPATPDDLPLYRAWRENAHQEATFVLARVGGVQHVTWSATPLPDAAGQTQGIVASVCVTTPEPDWEQLAGLAHDLRTPLQSLRMLVPVLETTPFLRPDATEMLERLRSAADRALLIALDLLAWCRGPAEGGKRVERAWFALVPVLSGIAAEHQPLAQRKGISLSIELAAAQGLDAHTDRARLQRLLSNLLSNAVRYTTVGHVRFTASWRAGEAGRREALALKVEDTGAGISAEEQESIFQPFERGKTGKESDSGGSGLGLAIVDRLVKELGLTLEVFSEQSRGSTFELLVPVAMVRPSQS